MAFRLRVASLVLAAVVVGSVAPAAAQDPQDERIAASFLLALGRLPSASETAAWTSAQPATLANLAARHRQRLQPDAAARQAVAAKADLDAFGGPGGDRSGAAVDGLYAELMQQRLAWLSGHPDEYAQVVQRAYRLVVQREAYDVELRYWAQRAPLSFALLAACIDDWARRNQPGLMATTGIPAASINSRFLATMRLSPATAAEARRAFGLAPSGSPALAAAAGRFVVAPGASEVVSVGGIHFAAAGGGDLRPVPEAAPGEQAGWRLAWHDEFESGIGPDWVFDIGVGRNGWGNNELETYTSRSENVRVESGLLIIEARREALDGRGFTSARLKTSGKRVFKYGRIEARIQIPRGQGVWPAFWALGENIPTAGWPRCGEIDIMENIGREPARVHATVHGPGYSGGKGVGAPFDLASGAFADGFHVFAVEWAPSSLRFSVDGTVYKSVTPADVPGEWVFDRPFFLLLNLAVGGNWPGSPDGGTPFPAQLKVDYVRAYERRS